MPKNEKQAKILKTTLDEVYAQVIVTQLAVVSLSFRLGQSNRVARDLAKILSRLQETEILKKAEMHVLNDGLIEAINDMEQLLTKPSEESSND